MNRIVPLAAAALAAAGCASPPTQYSWGSYEEIIYDSYASRGDASIEQQIEIMEREYQIARAANKRVPPGWHAHLGYLYYESGRPEEARRELQNEKAAFPESAVFIDRLLQNLQKP